jgi:dTMP kinase
VNDLLALTALLLLLETPPENPLPLVAPLLQAIKRVALAGALFLRKVMWGAPPASSMQRNAVMQRGKFITFEGIDGCGKTTQLPLLARHLAEQGIACLVTREPGGTAIGKRIRAVLLDVPGEQDAPVEPLTELLLYAADRAQHVRQLILPALAAGMIVLSDRYADATIAYQGYGRGFDLPMVEHLMELAMGGLKPDATLLFDLDVQTGLSRVHGRGKSSVSNSIISAPAEQPDRLDLEPLEFHERVRRGYHLLAAREPERFHLIPACGTIEEVQGLMLVEVEKLLSDFKPQIAAKETDRSP